jgi:hypothetical protein
MQILDDAEWMVHERLKADDRYIGEGAMNTMLLAG